MKARRIGTRSTFKTAALGSLLGSFALLFLVLSAPFAAASAPVFAYAPPLTGTTVKDSLGTPVVHGCGNWDQVSNGTLNLTTGKLGFAENGTAGLCGGHAQGGFQLVAHMTITSPKFTVNASGLFVLRTLWILNISASATLFDTEGARSACDCQISEFTIQFSEKLLDLTPFGASAIGFFADHAQVSNKNGTVHLSMAKVVSMPLAVVVTSGDAYRVVIVITLNIETGTQSNQPTNSTASVGVNLAPHGHPSVFQGFSIS